MSMPFIPDTAPEERDIVLASTERTKPKYPSPTPEDDRIMWERLIAERNAYLAAKSGEEDEAAPPFVAFPHVELEDPASAPGSVGTIAKRLLKRGWEVRVATNRALIPTIYFLNDSKEDAKTEHAAGDPRYPRYWLRSYWMVAVARDPRTGQISAWLEATWERKSKSIAFKSAVTNDPYLDYEYRPTMLTPRPPRDWEVQEGAAPPLGFGQWLNLMAPQPEKKKRAKEAA